MDIVYGILIVQHHGRFFLGLNWADQYEDRIGILLHFAHFAIVMKRQVERQAISLKIFKHLKVYVYEYVKADPIILYQCPYIVI